MQARSSRPLSAFAQSYSSHIPCFPAPHWLSTTRRGCVKNKVPAGTSRPHILDTSHAHQHTEQPCSGYGGYDRLRGACQATGSTAGLVSTLMLPGGAIPVLASVCFRQHGRLRTQQNKKTRLRAAVILFCSCAIGMLPDRIACRRATDSG